MFNYFENNVAFAFAVTNEQKYHGFILSNEGDIIANITSITN